MRCPYCFQALPDYSTQCQHCGSRLPAAPGRVPSQPGNPPPATPETPSPTPPLTARQTVLLLVSILLILACACLGLVALARPSLLPRPVIAVLPFLASPTPLPTAQVTPATIATPTPVVWQAYSNPRAGLALDFPAGWLVIDQSLPGWADETRDLAEDYGWAESLFETGITPPTAQTRAVDPAGVDLANGRLVVFTAGRAVLPGSAPTFADIETIARDQPAALAALAGGLTLIGSPETGYNFTARRSERVQVNGREALLVEFTADTTIQAQAVRVTVRLYFVPAGDDLLFVAYFADQQAASAWRAQYDQIVQSLRPD